MHTCLCIWSVHIHTKYTAAQKYLELSAAESADTLVEQTQMGSASTNRLAEDLIHSRKMTTRDFCALEYSLPKGPSKGKEVGLRHREIPGLRIKTQR